MDHAQRRQSAVTNIWKRMFSMMDIHKNPSYPQQGQGNYQQPPHYSQQHSAFQQEPHLSFVGQQTHQPHPQAQHHPDQGTQFSPHDRMQPYAQYGETNQQTPPFGSGAQQFRQPDPYTNAGQQYQASPTSNTQNLYQQSAKAEPSDQLGLWQRNDAHDENIQEEEETTSLFAKIIVSLLGITMFSGILWFGYTWMKQGDVSEPPFITAEQSPYKVKPDDPGGKEILHQEKLIYDAVSKDGLPKSDPIEHLLPAPEPEEVPVVKKAIKSVASDLPYFFKVMGAKNEKDLLKKWYDMIKKKKISGYNTVIREGDKGEFILYAGPFFTKKEASKMSKPFGKNTKIIQLSS